MGRYSCGCNCRVAVIGEMILRVHWINATRPHDEKVRVETVICNGILDFYGGGVELAKQSSESYQRNPRSPFHDWARAVHNGYRSAKGYITPTEYARLAFTTTFIERKLDA